MQEQGTVVLCENNSAIRLSKNPVFHGRSKNMDVCFHFLRDLTKEKSVELQFCSSRDRISDMMTKPLKLDQFLKL